MRSEQWTEEATQTPGSNSRLLAIFLICAGAFGWAGLEWLGSKAAGYSPYQVVWTRYGTHLLLLVVVLGSRDRARLVRTSRPFLQVFRSLLMLAMPVCFIMAAQRYLDIKLLWAITWISVPMMMGLAILLLGEPVTRSQWVMAGVGLGGVWLVLNPTLPRPNLALGMALVVAGSFALYVVLTRVLRTEYVGANLFHTAAWVFVPLSFYLPWVWQTPTLKVAMAMAGIGGVGLLLLFLIDRVLIHAPVALVAPFLFTECLWSAALSSLRPSLGLGPVGWVGAGLIVGSCGWVLSRELRARQARARAAVA